MNKNKCLIIAAVIMTFGAIFSLVFLCLIGLSGDGHLGDLVENSNHQELIDNYMNVRQVMDEIAEPFITQEGHEDLAWNRADVEDVLHYKWMSQWQYDLFVAQNPEIWEELGRAPMETPELEYKALNQEASEWKGNIRQHETWKGGEGNVKEEYKFVNANGHAKVEYRSGEFIRQPGHHDLSGGKYKQVLTQVSKPYEHMMSEGVAKGLVTGATMLSAGALSAGLAIKAYNDTTLAGDLRIRDAIVAFLLLIVLFGALVVGLQSDDFHAFANTIKWFLLAIAGTGFICGLMAITCDSMNRHETAKDPLPGFLTHVPDTKHDSWETEYTNAVIDGKEVNARKIRRLLAAEMMTL